EQAQGRAVGASDNYSLAVIAYQLFTGRTPFSGETTYAITIQHMTMPPPSPRQFNPYLPEACEQALMRGLAKRPTERFPSARLLVEELQRAFGGTAYQSALSHAPGRQASQPALPPSGTLQANQEIPLGNSNTLQANSSMPLAKLSMPLAALR